MLTRQNSEAKRLLAQKDRAILEEINQLGRDRGKTPVAVTQGCNHNSLITQYERALRLQEQELTELRKTVE